MDNLSKGSLQSLTRAIALTVMALCVVPTFTQTMKEWDNVSVTNLNRQRAHTLDVPMATAGAVAAAYTPTNALEASPYVKTLNGTWQFQWVGTPDKASDTFMRSDFNASSWDNIDVPSTWQVYGIRHGKQWDKPLYTNVAYPFSFDRETWSIMADRPEWFTYRGDMQNPVGSYRRTFTVPAEWKGRDVFVRFNGAGHGYYVWVNGQFVGYAEDSYLPSEWNITNLLQKGENTIAVRVYRFTSGSFLEDQDYWRLTGIMRDVFLWSAPKTRIYDFFFRTTELKSDNTEAAAALTVNIAGAKPKKATLEAQLCDGERVLASQSVAVTGTGDLNIQFPSVKGITAWSAEQPRLYDLRLTLNEKGKATDVRALKVGFRTVSVRNDGALLVNGNRIIFHGVDRHSFSENGGRTLTKADIETDLLQMKRLNVNAIRTSHYPDNPYFYDLCDRLGFYVLAEANVECHGNTRISHTEIFRQPMVERSVRQVLTLRNHSSIIIWSAGNECGNGNNFETVMDSIGRLDPTRLTHYEGNSQWSSVTSTMYANLDFIERTGRDRLRDFEQGRTGIRPHVQCENTHAMGNSMGNQREYYDLYEKYPALAGEFVWDWKDQGLKVSATNQPLTFEALGLKGKTDVRSILNPSKGEYWAYGGDFGDRPNDNNFCCNGVVLADCSPTAKSFNMKKVYQPIDFAMKDASTCTVTLHSKLQQRVLDDLAVSYSVLEDGYEISRGTINDVRLGVGATRDVTLTDVRDLLSKRAVAGAEYFIRFSATQKNNTEWADAGFEVAKEQLLLRAATDRKPYAPKTATALQVNKDNDAVSISGTDFSVRFAKGELQQYTSRGRAMLSAPLTLQAFRLPTDNERGRVGSYDGMGLRQLRIDAGTFEVNADKGGQSVDVSAVNTYTTETGTAFIVREKFHVMADGVIAFTATIDPQNKGAELPRLGFRTELPKEFETMRWMGRGPQDSYRDRKEAALIGTYKSRVSDQWTNYVLPQEHGNKEEVRWITVTDNNGTGLLVVAPETMAASASHWRPEDNYTNSNNRSRHPHEMKFCEQTVLNLDVYNRALGNASCGPDVINKYRIQANVAQMSLLFMPITAAQTDQQLAERARVSSPLCTAVDVKQTKDLVTLSSPTPDATIRYSIDGGKEKVYTAPFALADGGTVRAYATAPDRLPSLAVEQTINAHVDKSSWRIVSCSSEQGGNEAAANVIDGNPATFWHSRYQPDTPRCPHEIVVDMGAEQRLAAFVYQGREDMTNGRVSRYELYVGQPGQWGEPVLTGRLANNSSPQEINIPSRPSSRYFRFVVLSTHDRRDYASAAELGVLVEKNKRKK